MKHVTRELYMHNSIIHLSIYEYMTYVQVT